MAPGLRLVDAFEEEARSAGARVLAVVVRRAPGLGATLETRGWTAAPGMIRMRRGERRAPGPLPAGVEERALADVGLEAWRNVWNASFEGTPFQSPLRREALERLAAEPAFAPDLVRALVDGEGVCGFLHGTLDARAVGEVHDIGVLPRARGLGLGRWLLRRTAELLDGAGATEIVLRVAEANAVARRLYEGEGWTEVSRALAYRRDFPPRGAGSPGGVGSPG
jgi:mycothiol synthase